MNLKKKTRKRTRKFEIDGVVVTTTTSKIIYGDEENQTFYDEHYFRKQELRELKLLQKQEQKQFQVCTYLLVAVWSSGILKGKQKLGVTFNPNKLGVIDLTKISKLTMCSA